MYKQLGTSCWEKCNSRRIGKVSPAVAAPVDIYPRFGSKVSAMELSDWKRWLRNKSSKWTEKDISQPELTGPWLPPQPKERELGNSRNKKMEIVSIEKSSKSNVFRAKEASKGTSPSGK